MIDELANRLGRSGGDYVGVRVASAAGRTWTRWYPCPTVVDDIFVHPLIGETRELEGIQQDG